MYKKRLSLIICSSLFLSIVTALTINHQIVHADDLNIDSKWSKTTEGDDTIYTANVASTGDVAKVTIANTDVNTFEASFRANEAVYDKNVGMHVKSSHADYSMDYRQDVNAVRFRINDGYNQYSKTINVALNEWFTYKMIIVDGNVKCYVNNVLYYDYSSNDIELDATNEFYISTWGTNSSFKNAKYYNTNIPSPGNETDLTSSNWTGYDVVTFNNEKVYALPTDAAGRKNNYSGSMNFNVVEYDFTYSSAISGFNTGLYIEGTNRYGFRVEPYDGMIYIKNDTTNAIYKAMSYDFDENKTYHFKHIVDDTLLALYIDNELVAYTKTFDNENLTKTSAFYWNWGVTGYIKNYQTSTIEVPSLEDEQEYTPTDPNWPFTPSTFSITKEGETEVYTLLQPQAGVTYFKSKLENNNTFNVLELDMKLGVPTDAGNNRLFSGITLNVGTSMAYFIIRRNGELEANCMGADFEHKFIELKDGNPWYHFKLVFDDDYLKIYMDNELIGETYNTGGLDLSKAIPGFHCWGMKYSIKNIQTYKENITYPADYKKLDLEFSKEISVSSMEANNANLSYEDGQLVASITGNNPTIATPTIDVAPGHKYSMYLPVRNTLLVRLKNQTLSNKVRVHYNTSVNQEYVYQDFDISPNSDYQSYFFNLSALNPKGYLRNLKFEFLDANSGKIYINAITFEREEPIYDYAGSIEYCEANPTTNEVVVNGKVKDIYNGKTLTIYKSDPTNYNDSLYYKGLVAVATTTIREGKFAATFNLYLEDCVTSMLSSYFIAVVDGVKVSKHFKITNYEDFSKYHGFTTLNTDVVANVLDFGAKGDSFTDDTQAIQNAINYLNDLGGGTLLIPGDDSTYGKRYIMTHIDLCSNLNIVLEENAILWQSEREEELNKTVPVCQLGYNTVTYGHDVDIDGYIWCHTFATVNKPFILMRHIENVKISGGGTIRMMDVGNEEDDPYSFLGGVVTPIGIGSRVCQIPIYISECSNIDLVDITLQRSNAWHIGCSKNTYVYFGNVTEKEACSVTADGFGVASSKHVVIDRCFNYTSDDAITLSANTVDMRADFYAPMTYDKKYSTQDVTIQHSFIFGGFGLCFIPWGTQSENLQDTGIYDIDVQDNVFGGHKSSGSWPDDPWYGSSNYAVGYTQLEDNNAAPIYNVYLHNNTYLKEFNWTINGITPAATNFVVDDDVQGTVHGLSYFINNNFDRVIHKGTGFVDEKDWIAGLAYWTHKGNVGVEVIGSKQTKYEDANEIITQDDYAGYVKGTGYLAQGLYEVYGSYTFEVDYKSNSNNAILFVEDSLTHQIYATKELSSNTSFENTKLDFVLPTSTTILLGVKLDGNENDVVYIDNAKITSVIDYSIYEVEGEEATYSKVSDFDTYSSGSSSAKFVSGKIYTTADNETKIILKDNTDLLEFEVSVDIKALTDNVVNAGLYILANNANKSSDIIDAYNVQVESEAGSNQCVISIFKFTQKGGYEGTIVSSKRLTIENEKIHLRVVVINSNIFVFVDDNKDYILSMQIRNIQAGSVGLRSQFVSAEFSNFTLKVQKVLPKCDLSSLTLLLADVKKIDSSLYTSTSYASLRAVLNEAYLLTENNTQEEIDDMIEKIKSAVEALEEKEQPSEQPSEEPSEAPSEEPSDNPSFTPTSEVESSSSNDDSDKKEDPRDKKGCKGITSGLLSMISILGLTLLKKKKQM